MLALFRRFLNTWPAKVFFLVLCAAFAVWGVGDMIRNIGHDDSVASIAGHKIQQQDFQTAYDRQMRQVTQQLGQSQATPELRRQVALQTIDGLLTQAALMNEAQRLGIRVPDAALRSAVFSIPAFRGPDGRFNRAAFENVLRNNGMTEGQFLEMFRADLAQRQMLEAVSAGATAPTVLLDQVFAFQHETRTAQMAEFPLSAAPPPPAPADAVLQRWYDNHPETFTSPEYRRIKLIVLSPETLAKGVAVPEADERAWYEQHKAAYVTAPKRSVDVLLAQQEGTAQALGAQWGKGADWATMEAAAKKAGATSVSLTDAPESEFPAPELGKAVFSAPPDAVVGPLKTALGWYVLKVTKVTPGIDRSFDQVRQEIHDRLAAEKAAGLVYERANKIEDILASGTQLGELPADLGVAAVEGTLDAQGDTPEGQPAPVPGSEALRAAVLTAAFSTNPGDPPQLTEVPPNGAGASSYYALSVEKVIPPAKKPFDQVKAQAVQDWTRAQRRHAQETAAANLMEAVNGGASLPQAAHMMGVAVHDTPPLLRTAPVEGVPPELVPQIFALKKAGQATMVETGSGFTVAALTKITDPDPKTDPVGMSQLRATMDKEMAQDLGLTFAAALRQRAHPYINQSVLDGMVRQ